MKKLLFILMLFLIGIFSSCSTTYVVKNYPQDDVYYKKEKVVDVVENQTIVDTNNYDDNYDDYVYTTRIRRFYSPISTNYFTFYYTNPYWYYDDYFYLGNVYYPYYTPYYYSGWYYNYGFNFGYPYYWNYPWGYPYYSYWNHHHNHWNNYGLNNGYYYGPRDRGSHLGNNPRQPRTPQGGKDGKVGKNTNQNPIPKKYESKPVEKYSKPNNYNQEERKNENYKRYPTKPKTYVSPQYSKPRTSYEYVAPSTERRKVENRNSGENNKPQYRQEKAPSYTPRPAPSRSTPKPSNNGRSSGSPRQSRTR